MNIMRRCMCWQWIWVSEGMTWKNTLKECMRVENIRNFEQDSFFLMHPFMWSFFDCCSISTLLTNMVPSVLMQFNNVPFQITLNIRYRSTHLKAFVLSNFNRHMKEYHEKVYLKTVDKLHQKGMTWRNTLKESMGTRKFEQESSVLMYSLKWSFSDWCIHTSHKHGS